MDVSSIGPFLTASAAGGPSAAPAGGLFESLLGEALGQTAGPDGQEQLSRVTVFAHPAAVADDGAMLIPLQAQLADDAAATEDGAPSPVAGDDPPDLAEALAGAAMLAPEASIAPPPPVRNLGTPSDDAALPDSGAPQPVPNMASPPPDDEFGPPPHRTAVPENAVPEAVLPAPPDEPGQADAAPQATSPSAGSAEKPAPHMNGQNLPPMPAEMSGPRPGGNADGVRAAADRARVIAQASASLDTPEIDSDGERVGSTDTSVPGRSGAPEIQPRLPRSNAGSGAAGKPYAAPASAKDRPAPAHGRQEAAQDRPVSAHGAGHDRPTVFVPIQPGPADRPEPSLMATHDAPAAESPHPVSGAHHAVAALHRGASPEAAMVLRDARIATPSPAIEQVAFQVRHGVQANMDRFTIHLRPAELGRVDVRMDINVDGSVLVEVAAERPETLELLQREARALERALHDAGLRADPGSLSFNLRGDDRHQRGAPQDQERRGGGPHDDAPETGGRESDLTAAVIQHMTPAPGRVDLKI